jgi:hypothetical protein
VKIAPRVNAWPVEEIAAFQAAIKERRGATA